MGYLALIIITIVTSLLTSCGTMPSQHSRSHTLGGVETPFRELPGYMVKIKVQKDGWFTQQSATCSGVHVGDGVILTAAHCLIHNLDTKQTQTKWKPGLYNFDKIIYLSRRKSGTIMPRHLSAGEIDMAVYHHSFPNDYYDLAVIFTKPKVPFSDAALLPDKDYTHQPRSVDVYGVGLSFADRYHFPDSHKNFSGSASIDVDSRHTLKTYSAYSKSQGQRSQTVHQQLMDATTLIPPMSFFISTWSQPAVGSAIQGICPGDSGGPVVIPHPESPQDIVIGTLSHIDLSFMLYQGKLKEFFDIASNIEDCVPFIAVNHLFEYLPWLKEVMGHYQKIHRYLSRSRPISLSSEQLKSLATKNTKY